MAWKINQRLIDNANTALEELQEAIQKKRDEFDARSEQWQESEIGEAVATWIECCEDYIGNTIAELENIETEPDA